jgi:Mg-chelatase subunit ChlI
MNKVNLRLDSGLTGIDAIEKDYVNLLMVGKPGTGKTTLAYALGAATGMPVYSIALNKDSESDVFQGMTKVVDGQLQIVSTDFLDAYKNGGIVVLEEINLANPNIVMGTIGQAVEFPFVLMENGYKPIRRHPLCVIIGTMNVGTYGSTGLNEAMSSRFKTTYTLEDPKDEDFIRILEKSGGSTKACRWVLKIYKKILDYLMSPSVNAEDVCMRLTMRGCIGALEGIEEGESPKEAIRRTLIGKIAESDLDLANAVWQDIQNIPDFK